MADAVQIVCGNVVLVGVGVAFGAALFASMVGAAIYAELSDLLDTHNHDEWP